MSKQKNAYNATRDESGDSSSLQKRNTLQSLAAKKTAFIHSAQKVYNEGKFSDNISKHGNKSAE